MSMRASALSKSSPLFERLGGEAAISAAVEEFYRRVLADTTLKPFFAKTNLAWLKKRQTQFLVQATGGPAAYRGPDMRKAHEHLAIEECHFDRVAGHLVATLKSLRVPMGLIDEVVGVVAPLKSDIVNTSSAAGRPQGGSMSNGRFKGKGVAVIVEESSEAMQARALAMVENAPVNIICADTDLRIQYVNPASVRTLKTLQEHLPVKVDDIVGQSIDIFHKNPASVRKIVSNPANLPHRAKVQLGPETLDLLVTAIRDDSGNYLGPMVTWEVVTEKLRLESEVARVMSMVENMPINVICADTELKIRYMNPASLRTLKSLEHLLPCKAEQIVGQSIDLFHKNPERQRRILSDPRNLPHRAEIVLGTETLDLTVSGIYDQNKTYIGPMVTWSVVTEKIGVPQAVEEIAHAVASSSEELTAVSQQMGANAEQTATQMGVVSAAVEEASNNVQAVATAMEEMSASIKEIAKHANDAAKVASAAVQIAETTNTTIGKLGESSADIGKVIKVITSIAQQTNLLALNATIEAARAGEAGKGFAVVANEVKELAKETAKATEDIGQKIEAIQKDTKGAVEAIGEIGTIINKINDISSSIASAVEEQTATTDEVSRNVAEAAKTSAEIARNITAVAEVAKNTTQGAGDTQRAAAELSKMAGELRTLVAKFKD